MKDCTIVSNDGISKVVFRQNSGDDLVWVETFEDDQLIETFGFNENLAQAFRLFLLEQTDSAEDPYNNVKVTHKGKK